MLMVREKGFYKRLLMLAAPLALQSVISFSVGLADNIMVGSLGEKALSGVYIANQLQNILHMLVVGLSAALMVLGSQFWGKRDKNKVKEIIGISLKFGMACGLFLTLLTLFLPRQVLQIFTNQPAVIDEAMKYLTVIRFSYLFFCITQVLIASMRCVETVRVGMYLSMMTFFINVCLNWILIFGNLGAPALGIQGAAIATLVSRFTEMVVITLYVRFFDTKLMIRFKELLKSDIELVRRYFKYGLPVILGDIFWGVNLAVQGAIIGRLGETATASVSIANTFFSILSVAVYGTAGATAIIIGQTVGAGEYKKLREYVKTLQVLFIGVGLVSGAVIFLVKDAIRLVYDLAPETMDMTRSFLIVLSIMIVGTAYQVSCLTGIVRAGGATHFVLVNDLIWVWCVLIPSASLAAFVFHASPVVVFALLKCDQILKCFVAVIKVNRFRWIKNLTYEKAAPKAVPAQSDG